MYNKQLYRTALMSSPIMAVFELSPIFFFDGDTSFNFWTGAALMSIITMMIWWMNIALISFFETRKRINDWKRYFFSFFIVCAFVCALKFTIHFFPPPKQPLPLLFPIINNLALNTIILIISNSIILRSKKIQTDQEMAILKIKNLEAEQQQLIQQMQPHFLFNALSTLKSLINKDTELAEEYLMKLADFLRFTISALKKNLIPLTEELKFTDDYIKLQQIRFSDSILCDITISEEEQKQYFIPIYALQTLVENAIKHNAFTEEQPLKLIITLREGNISVFNNKIPKPAFYNITGVGLQNLDKRYTLIGGENIIIDNKPDSFMVTIKLISKTKVC
jgi:two-component system, LytTR family, sensor kinase